MSKVCARFGVGSSCHGACQEMAQIGGGFSPQKSPKQVLKKYFGVGSSCEGACQEMLRLLSANLYFHFSTSSRGKLHTRKMGLKENLQSSVRSECELIWQGG